MTHIFLSYSHEDEDHANYIKGKLEDNNFTVWFDGDIEAGEEWKKEITDAIEASFAIIIIYTKHAHNSDYVTYEWAYADGLGKPIIRLQFDVVESPHERLKDIQMLDFSAHYEKDRPIDELINSLKKYQSDSERENEEKLREQLSSPNFRRIRRIKVKVETAVTVVEGILEDSNSTIQKNAVSFLYQQNASESDFREYIFELLTDIIESDQLELKVKEEAIDVLSEYKHIDDVIDKFVKYVAEPPDLEVRKGIIKAIWRRAIHHKDIIKVLVKALDDDDTREDAEDTLDHIYSGLDKPLKNIWIKEVKTKLTSINIEVAKVAVNLLNESGDTDAEQELLKVVVNQKTHLKLRNEIIDAFESRRRQSRISEKILLCLVELLEDENPQIRQNVSDALETIYRELTEEMKSVWIKNVKTRLKSEKEEVAKIAISLLSDVDSKEAEAPLLQVLRDNTIDIRLRLHIIDEIGNRRRRVYRGSYRAISSDVIECLTDLLEDENAQIVLESSKALERIYGLLSSKGKKEWIKLVKDKQKYEKIEIKKLLFNYYW